jgi:hypothetical protein
MVTLIVNKTQRQQPSFGSNLINKQKIKQLKLKLSQSHGSVIAKDKIKQIT